jgi:hypothetical protein
MFLGGASVRGDDVPMAIDDERRVGLVRGQEPLERLADGRHLARPERALAEDGREAGREEEAVPLSQRNLEALGEVEEHLAARPCAPRLDEAEMPRRDRRLRGEFTLRELAPFSPLPEERPRRRCALVQSHTGHNRSAPTSQVIDVRVQRGQHLQDHSAPVDRGNALDVGTSFGQHCAH